MKTAKENFKHYILSVQIYITKQDFDVTVKIQLLNDVKKQGYAEIL